ncbi:hypothetical protein WUBG_07860 [Wuchereria bancrofti]|uniref:Uncharacterized protein n=1 Tax=Wuchereria bancrofti TaxID=6293 RepID=J9EFJ8_WUCBA|nr:hypothetical protein WUBG_07860 [Wuchereria bancrofti]
MKISTDLLTSFPVRFLLVPTIRKIKSFYQINKCFEIESLHLEEIKESGLMEASKEKYEQTHTTISNKKRQKQNKSLAALSICMSKVGQVFSLSLSVFNIQNDGQQVRKVINPLYRPFPTLSLLLTPSSSK